MSAEAKAIERVLETGDYRASTIARKIAKNRWQKLTTVPNTLARMVDKGIVVIVGTEPFSPDGSGGQINVYGLASRQRIRTPLVDLLARRWSPITAEIQQELRA